MKRLLYTLQSNRINYLIIAIFLFIISLNYYIIFILFIFYLLKYYKRIEFNFLLPILLFLLVLFSIISTNNRKTINNKFTITDKKSFNYSNMYTIKKYYNKYIIYSNYDYKIGEVISIKGEVEKFNTVTIPGGFDQLKYYNQKGIKGEIINYNISTEGKINYMYYFNIKNYSNTNFTNIFFGNNTFEDETNDSLSNLNILVILSLSGIHIYSILNLLKYIFTYFNLESKYQVLIKYIILLFLYIFSLYNLVLLRIIVYEVLKLISKFFNFKINNFVLLNITFLILIIIKPYSLIGTNFLLSYLIVISIFLLRPLYSSDRFVIRTLKINIIITLITIPFINKFNLFSIILSPVIIIFISCLLLPLILLSLLSSKVGSILNIIESIIKNINFDNFNIYLPKINILLILLYFSCLLYLLYTKNKYKYISVVLILVILLSPNIIRRFQDPKLYFLDVGQGDTAVYISSSNVIVIDAYNGIDNFLKSKGINKIDYLILTHSDNDHIKEANKLLNNYQIKNLIVSNYDNNYNLTNSSLNIIYGKSNLKIDNNDFKLYFYGPLKDYKTTNNNSLVFKLSYDETSILFCGDIELEAELDLVNTYGSTLSSNIIKVPHHGSNTSSSIDFLKVVNPKSAIISVATNNKYNLPNNNIINRYKQLNINVYQTNHEYTILIYNNNLYFPMKNNYLSIYL